MGVLFDEASQEGHKITCTCCKESLSDVSKLFDAGTCDCKVPHQFLVLTKINNIRISEKSIPIDRCRIRYVHCEICDWIVGFVYERPDRSIDERVHIIHDRVDTGLCDSVLLID